MHAESTEDKLIAAINKEPKHTPAPQVEMVSELPELPDAQEFVFAADSYGYDMLTAGKCYYTADQMRAYAQAALNARAGGDAKGAERYRLLRDIWHVPYPLTPEVAKVLDAFNAGDTIEIDAAIDAALASQAVGVKDGR